MNTGEQLLEMQRIFGGMGRVTNKEADALVAAGIAADKERIAQLEDALDHIRKTASQSRSQSRRIRWIEQRAIYGIEGKHYDNMQFDLPKNATVTAEKLGLKVRQLEARNAELEQDAARYRFVRELAWYVDMAAEIYVLGGRESPWPSDHLAVDADDVEDAIDAALSQQEATQ